MKYVVTLLLCLTFSSLSFARKPAVEPFVGVESKDYKEVKLKYNNPLVFKNVNKNAATNPQARLTAQGFWAQNALPLIISLILVGSPLLAWAIVNYNERKKIKSSLEELKNIDFVEEVAEEKSEEEKISKAS
jgi:hypothetical protein